MKRNEFLRLSAALPLAMMTGCGDSNGQTAAQKHRIAMVVKSTKTTFWKTAYAGAQTAATEYNAQLSFTGPETEEDYESQNERVAQAVKDGAEAIVFSAIDFEQNAAAIEAASDAGVQIVTIDSDVDTDKKATYIGTDNYKAGCMAAEAALQANADKTLTVGFVNYGENSANGQLREQGVRDTLATHSRVAVAAAINTLASAETSESDTAQMLREHPEIDVLFAFNEPVSVGAARALRVMGKAEKVWMAGFDSNVETVDMLQTGEVDALIVQNPYAMGYLGVESAVALLNGRGAELESIVDTSTVLVNRDNLFTSESQKILFSFN